MVHLFPMIPLCDLHILEFLHLSDASVDVSQMAFKPQSRQPLENSLSNFEQLKVALEKRQLLRYAIQ